MSTVAQALAAGIAHHQAGRLVEAEAAYRLVLQLQPDHAQAWYFFGGLAYQSGNPELAAQLIGQAAESAPDSAEYQYDRGLILQELRKLDEAAACYRRALVLNPNLAEVLLNLGNVLQEQQKLNEAAAAFRRALEIRPDFVEAHNNLGNALTHLGNLSEAMACYHRALALKPDFAEAHNNLATAFKHQDRLDEAVASYRRAIELKPSFAAACASLGTALNYMARLDEAVAWLRKSLTLDPALQRGHSNLLFILHYSPAYDAAAIYQELCCFNERFAAPLAASSRAHANDPSPGRRLKIGYVSPNFRENCLALFMTPLFGHHDHQQFKIYLYSDVACPDATTDRLRATADIWQNIAGLTDEQVADLVRQDQIDILVDLTMHMDQSRLLVFARKPAPVQATWLAYPGTTGLTAIDYRLTDPRLDPPGLFDACYAEESIRLPDTFWCYDPLTSEPTANDLPALSNGFITFGCLNNFCKLNASTLQLWSRVLNAAPSSRLILLTPEGSCLQWVLQALTQENISADRITFASLRPRRQYLELYHKIDIALDTLPYNGHTTSLDALWMGVPVVTLVGQTVVGRAGLSQLTNLNMTELVSLTPDEFVQIAAALATDLPRLGHLRSTLRCRMEQSPLMDAPRFARSIEAAYQQMWQRWCAPQ